MSAENKSVEVSFREPVVSFRLVGPRTLSVSHLADTLFSAFIDDLCSCTGKVGIWMFVCFVGML